MTKTVVIRTPRTVVSERASQTLVRSGVRGPQGLPGDKGDKGEPAISLTHTQPSAELVWVINHNLGYWPAVSVTDTAGRELDADVFHASTNQMHLLFCTPFAGFARLT